MKNIINATIKKIKLIESDLANIAAELDSERKESTQEDNLSIHNELIDKKQYLEKQLAELQNSLAELNNLNRKIKNTEILTLGMKATININGEERKDITFVSPVQADPTKGLISAESPIGKALLGQTVGYEARVKTPSGEQHFSILKIRMNTKK